MMPNDRSTRSSSKETMTASRQETRKPRQEHSVPWFWPFAAAIEFGEEGMRLFQNNLKFLTEAQLINAPPAPEWTTPESDRPRTGYDASARFLHPTIGRKRNSRP